ncbi:unnamed protein product [Polarella glacialis]|uniref:P-type sodium-transporting ATPase4 n=1 Tax=Polarella glacialis TaxID=89957 RepID=A0A813I958_POLGL|nr:unnamed protein product [Polarella glacialis]
MVFGQRRRVQDGPGFDVHKDVRHILLGEPCDDHKEAVHATHYPLNTITTSKYTVLNFVPKNIWEQLHKAANAYFLAISVIMFIGNYTPLFLAFIKFYSTFAALAVMMIASGVIAALDDRRRHIADRQTNGQRGFVVQTDSAGNVHILDTKWGELLVGDVVIVRGEEEFPADLVPLASSGEDGSCYVSTANLDGETNLKLKMSASSSQKALCEDASDGTALLNQAASRLGGLRGTMRAEAPQKSIHNFTGSVTVDGCAEEALGPRQFLLRGTVLRNTAWVLGVVVYTGPHTRMVMNSRKAPSKLANLERVINASLLVVVGAQCVLALISDILYMATKHRFLGYWYLYPGGQTTTIILPEWIGYWLTFFVLYSNLMPISLYFTMEVCNAAQAWFIKNDLEMYDEEIDCPANARSTNLGHELGQVSYIFSDKTGTLTQNVMELKQVSIAGEIYGEVGEAPGFHGGRALALARIQDTKKAAAIDAFLEVLAVSHTVVASTDQSGNLKYEAESPDEGALVEAVSRLGWAFKGRTTSTLSVEVGQPGQTQSVKYQVLALNAFTSKRKRQSVIVKRPSGEVVLLVKGADDIMQLKARDAASFPEEHLLSFAKEGLRTLVLGRRSLSETELAAWLADYAKAQTNMEDRDRTLELVAETIERDLEIVGVTAIEDKLQVGVQETIVKIREAGIKLWVLTGDKLETARNIGFSTRVLSSGLRNSTCCHFCSLLH